MFIPTQDNVRTVTDMRERAIELLEDVKKQGLVYLFQHSSPEAVMLSIEEFRRIQELIEDHLDEDEAQKLAKEERGKGIPLASIVARHKKRLRV